MNLEIMYTAAKIKAIQDPARLERVRQRRDAIPGAPHRGPLAWQVGAGLNRAGAWLQGVPAIVPVIAGALEVPSVEPGKVPI